MSALVSKILVMINISDEFKMITGDFGVCQRLRTSNVDTYINDENFHFGVVERANGFTAHFPVVLWIGYQKC